jgi:hypothetical protein
MQRGTMHTYDDKNGMRVRRVPPKLMAHKLLGYRLAVANATAFNCGPYSPYDYCARPKECAQGLYILPINNGPGK